MEILRFKKNELPSKRENLTMVLGYFDGMHLGHQSLFFRAKMAADNESAALFFTSLPFKGSQTCLTSLEDKLRFANQLGLDVAYVYEPDDAFFALSKGAFIEDFLKPLGVTKVVVGEDYRFGRKAEGKVEDLKRAFDVEVVPMKDYEGSRISSSRIKETIKEGNVEDAFQMLGRPYEIMGKIVHGKKRGRTIGFPTLNFDLSSPYLLPKDGIYAGIAYVLGLPHLALINVGKNPTFKELETPLVEAHLIDYDGDAYGKTVYLQFLKQGRGEKTFKDLNALKEQLEIDKEWLLDLKLLERR